MLPWSNRKPPRSVRKRAAKPAWLVQSVTGQTAEPDLPAVTPPKKTPNPLAKQAGMRRQSSGRADTHTSGLNAEHRAALWLTEQGLPVVGMNVRCRHGEIDLIVACGQTAVIVEVRSRNDRARCSAGESIDWHKRRRIIRTALWWWSHTGRQHFHSLRFDTVTFDASRQPEWTCDAFDAQGSI